MRTHSLSPEHPPPPVRDLRRGDVLLRHREAVTGIHPGVRTGAVLDTGIGHARLAVSPAGDGVAVAALEPGGAVEEGGQVGGLLAGVGVAEAKHLGQDVAGESVAAVDEEIGQLNWNTDRKISY